MQKQGRVLIVDDVEQWREELVETLEHGGFQVDSASTPTEALDRLNEQLYHLIVLDIRMNEADPSNMDGIELLRELDKRGLNEAIKVVMLSAHGTAEQMRTAFREHGVADFLSKDKFTNRIFLENIRQVLTKQMNINLALEVHWQQVRGPEQVVLNLELNGIRIKRNTLLQHQLVAELEDLLCRLFYQAKGILVRPLASGQRGTSLLSIQPFYNNKGVGHEVIVKFGDFRLIEEEFSNFEKYVHPFIGGGRNTTILDLRRTPHLGGIIYSLLGTSNHQQTDFGDFYRHADLTMIRNTLDCLFLETCGAWYANRGQLQPIDLTADYQRLLEYAPEKLVQVVSEQLKSVQGKQRLHFNHLSGKRSFTSPILAIAKLSLVLPTYLCITHGDFNQHNLLVDSTGHVWMIDFQGTERGHILRDVARLDSIVRFQLLEAEEAFLEERLNMEEALCSIERFSQVEQLTTRFSTTNQALAKTYGTVVHLRALAYKLVEQNPIDDISEYYIALMYIALNTLRISSLPLIQHEHALLCASLLADRLGLGG